MSWCPKEIQLVTKAKWVLALEKGVVVSQNDVNTDIKIYYKIIENVENYIKNRELRNICTQVFLYVHLSYLNKRCP